MFSRPAAALWSSGSRTSRSSIWLRDLRSRLRRATAILACASWEDRRRRWVQNRRRRLKEAYFCIRLPKSLERGLFYRPLSPPRTVICPQKRSRPGEIEQPGRAGVDLLMSRLPCHIWVAALPAPSQPTGSRTRPRPTSLSSLHESPLPREGRFVFRFGGQPPRIGRTRGNARSTLKVSRYRGGALPS